MSLIHRIFGHSDTSLVCPRCERPLEGHSDADCARKLSRRWFLGATLGVVAGAVVAPPVVKAFTQADVIASYRLSRDANFRNLVMQAETLYGGGRGYGKTEALRHWVTNAVGRGDRVIAPQLDGSVLTGQEWLLSRVRG